MGERVSVECDFKAGWVAGSALMAEAMTTTVAIDAMGAQAATRVTRAGGRASGTLSS
jgi:hypothetical protein